MLIDKIDTYGFATAIRAMRNPLDSWDRSDSEIDLIDGRELFVLGEKDAELARKQIVAGDEHAKFTRFITMSCDIRAPLNWWHEFDTYRNGVISEPEDMCDVERLSCSTMHKLGTRDLDENDFEGQDVDYTTLAMLNEIAYLYRTTRDFKHRNTLRNRLPWNYLQTSTVQFSYQALRRIYIQRKTHRLYQWRIFCLCVEKLPWFEDLIYPEWVNNDAK